VRQFGPYLLWVKKLKGLRASMRRMHLSKDMFFIQSFPKFPQGENFCF
jgi:hypothetical protein